MSTARNVPAVHDCSRCGVRTERMFCNLPESAIEAMERLTFPAMYPKGATLFYEGQAPRGVFILCSGKAKLFVNSSEGKTLIVRVAEPGEVLGMSASISGQPYEVTVETLEPCQLNFIRRDDFLGFLDQHPEACFHAALEMSDKYNAAQREIKVLGLSQSAGEKLARLFLNWCPANGASKDIRVPLLITHEEIAQMIGISRETVTRLLGDLKRKQVIQIKGATLVIRDKQALEDMVSV